MLSLNRKIVFFSMYVHGCFVFFSLSDLSTSPLSHGRAMHPILIISHRFSNTNMSSDTTQASSADAQMLDAAAALVAAHAEIGPNFSLGECTQPQTSTRSGTSGNQSALTLNVLLVCAFHV
jgi:hypothetical protein